MPTYQYACSDCAKPLEVVQSFSDDPLVECPACGGRLRKVFSPVGVVFKGSGFYRTDSRSAQNGKANGKATKDGDGAGSSSGGESSGSKADGAGSKDTSGSGSDSASKSSGDSGSNGSTRPKAATKAGSGS